MDFFRFINKKTDAPSNKKELKILIYSRKEVEKIIQSGFPKNTAVISFYNPSDSVRDKIYAPVDYAGKPERIFQVALYDIHISMLRQYRLTYQTYFPEASALAKFIYQAKTDGLDIICQCEHGESRSPACAAAILEHFYKNGISIFADYRYFPNQLVYHKIFDALENLHGK